ncbi:MAG: DDE-type integrase/transposase/recombinase [Candidatus Eremiobacteraeota bacterium]|nr:DDE-type integrase/transposase/recombinase [Candidatus Eremiobacteraeota bacterium]MCW5872458.1 DDE-type integrase/transposase/recombinase [Candidatus Eremiobacteraeota bacterium]
MHRTKYVRYRGRQADAASEAPDRKHSRPTPGNALSESEEKAVLDVLNSPEFLDHSPYTVYHGLLDRGQRLCSISTMYRLLRKNGFKVSRQVRRRKASHAKPQLSATEPRQVWSWDVTLLRGPVRGVFYYLYAMIDIFSRKVVAWMLAKREGEDLAAESFALPAPVRVSFQGN